MCIGLLATTFVGHVASPAKSVCMYVRVCVCVLSMRVCVSFRLAFGFSILPSTQIARAAIKTTTEHSHIVYLCACLWVCVCLCVWKAHANVTVNDVCRGWQKKKHEAEPKLESPTQTAEIAKKTSTQTAGGQNMKNEIKKKNKKKKLEKNGI